MTVLPKNKVSFAANKIANSETTKQIAVENNVLVNIKKETPVWKIGQEEDKENLRLKNVQ